MRRRVVRVEMTSANTLHCEFDSAVALSLDEATSVSNCGVGVPSDYDTAVTLPGGALPRHATGVEVDGNGVQPGCSDSFQGPGCSVQKIPVRAAKRVESSFSSLEGKIVGARERAVFAGRFARSGAIVSAPDPRTARQAAGRSGRVLVPIASAGPHRAPSPAASAFPQRAPALPSTPTPSVRPTVCARRDCSRTRRRLVQMRHWAPNTACPVLSAKHGSSILSAAGTHGPNAHLEVRTDLALRWRQRRAGHRSGSRARRRIRRYAQREIAERCGT